MYPQSSESSQPKLLTVKFVVGGPFGVGKTTLVSSVSDIPTLRTEELLTHASSEVDHITGVTDKRTTTVAAEFGKIQLPSNSGQEIEILLFGAPGQERFLFMWEELTNGAIGAVVLVDTRKFEECFPSIEFFVQKRIPMVVAVNEFDDGYRYHPDEVRAALRLNSHTPVLLCDARDRETSARVLMRLVEHAIDHMAHAAEGAVS
nr:ATP/GTP-binding protein [Streptomyces noursei]